MCQKRKAGLGSLHCFKIGGGKQIGERSGQCVTKCDEMFHNWYRNLKRYDKNENYNTHWGRTLEKGSVG